MSREKSESELSMYLALSGLEYNFLKFMYSWLTSGVGRLFDDLGRFVFVMLFICHSKGCTKKRKVVDRISLDSSKYGC